MAADRRVVSAGTIMETTKIRRTKDGRLLGGAGNAVVILMWMDWLERGGERPEILSDENDSVDGLEIKANGEIWEHSRLGCYRNESAFAATGSGFQFALAAMVLGCDAKAAILVASQLDPKTGNGCDVLTLES